MKKLSKELLHTEYIIERKSMRKIAKKVGWSYSFVRKQILRYEIPLRTNGESLMGHVISKATRKKIAKARLGYKVPQEIRAKISKLRIERGTFKGKNNPMYGKSRNKNPNWQGGISKLPYSFEFTEELKNEIRERDEYTCQLCRCTEEEHILIYGVVLTIHHIDYDKENCNKNNLVSLCKQCNSRVNHNREYWKEYFNNLLKTESKR